MAAAVAFKMSTLSLKGSMSAPKATLGRSSFGGKQVRLAPLRLVQKIETSIEAKQGHNRAGKLKTNKAAAKRFRVSGAGKVRYLGEKWCCAFLGKHLAARRLSKW
eukprot:74278-Prorocentrum_minimum.AAC.3